MSSPGKLIRSDDSQILSFSRSLAFPVEEVWQAFMHPEAFKSWLMKGHFDEAVGGKIEMKYKRTGYTAKGIITKIKQNALLDHTWEDENVQGSTVHWKFNPGANNTCILILEHTFHPSYELSLLAAGWHLHLDLFTASLEGKEEQWSWETWESLNAEYEKAFQVL